MKKKRSFLVVVNLSVVGIVCGVILLVSILFFCYLYGINDKNTMDTLNKDLSQIDQELTKNVEEVHNITSQLAADVQLGQAMEKYYSGSIEDSVEGKKMLDYIMSNAITMNSSIENITLCSRNDMVQYNNYSLNKQNNMAEVIREQWYKELLVDKVSWVFDASHSYTSGAADQQQYFFCATKFKNKFYQNRSDENRIVIVTFQLKILETLMDNTADLKKINLLLYDPADRNIIYNKGVTRRYRDITKDWEAEYVQHPEMNKMFITLENTNSLTKWNLEGFVDRSVYMAMVYPIQGWILGVIIFVLVISVIMSVLIFRTISRPLKNVVQGMDDLGNQDFYMIQDTGQYRETDQLITTFNHMSERIQGLILNIEQKAKEKRKEEFRVLESQINPHFIYNTLEAIRWVALMNNSKPTAEVISSFVKFLRITLSGGKELISVDKEIEVTKEYIKIMVFRNNYNIEFTYEIEERVRQLYTLKMVLQPLVENCFIHAFDKEQKYPKILIRCYIDEQDYMIMEVRDNGKGLNCKSQASADKPLLTGIGIHNIDERIKIWHGNKYGLTIESLPMGGTVVRLLQPIMVGEKGGYNDTGNAD